MKHIYMVCLILFCCGPLFATEADSSGGYLGFRWGSTRAEVLSRLKDTTAIEEIAGAWDGSGITMWKVEGMGQVACIFKSGKLHAMSVDFVGDPKTAYDKQRAILSALYERKIVEDSIYSSEGEHGFFSRWWGRGTSVTLNWKVDATSNATVSVFAAQNTTDPGAGMPTPTQAQKARRTKNKR